MLYTIPYTDAGTIILYHFRFERRRRPKTSIFNYPLHAVGIVRLRKETVGKYIIYCVLSAYAHIIKLWHEKTKKSLVMQSIPLYFGIIHNNYCFRDYFLFHGYNIYMTCIVLWNNLHYIRYIFFIFNIILYII